MKFLLFGILQAITEFLPVSSSGHLYLLKKILSFNENLFAFFVFLHIPSLLAIIIFFRREIFSFIFEKKILFHTFIITVITAVFGLFVEKNFKDLMQKKYFVSLCFLINSILLLSLNKNRGKKNIEEIGLKDSILLGFFQGLAVFYGISRSGITITTLLKQKFKPKDSFKFSFFIGIPVIFGAFILESKEFLKFKELNISNFYLFITFLVTFFASLLVLKFLKKIILLEKFRLFGYYCLFIFFISLFV